VQNTGSGITCQSEFCCSERLRNSCTFFLWDFRNNLQQWVLQLMQPTLHVLLQAKVLDYTLTKSCRA